MTILLIYSIKCIPALSWFLKKHHHLITFDFFSLRWKKWGDTNIHFGPEISFLFSFSCLCLSFFLWNLQSETRLLKRVNLNNHFLPSYSSLVPGKDYHAYNTYTYYTYIDAKSTIRYTYKNEQIKRMIAEMLEEA